MEKNLSYKQIEENRWKQQLKNPVPEKMIITDRKKDNLKIVYVMKWTGVCGGSKIIFEHCNLLVKRGHEVYVVCHDEKPIWFKLDEKVKYLQVPFNEIVCDYIPNDVDVIICSSTSFIYEAIEQRKAPVIYFEQGDHHLFNRQIVNEEKLDFISKELELCNNVFTVSQYAKEKIYEIYKKDAEIIPNAVNGKIFYPEIRSEKSEKINITAIGGIDWEFKGIKYILEAVKNLKDKYDISFNWITPTEPEIKMEKTIINPEQIVIGDVLRSTDIYICASEYESFGLPILEAMKCGACVVTTDTGGNREFAIDKQTCLVINKKDINDIVEKVELLIKDENLRKKLVENSKIKAAEYTWERTIDELEKYYRKIAQYTVGK